jgi:hypothetical protein
MAAQKLSITKRGGAQIGGSIVNRTQMHGKKEKVPAVSVPVSGIILTPEEFCTLMRDPHAYESFFTDERSQVMEPRFPGVDIILPWKFENAKVTITPEDADEPLILKPATVASIVITPMASHPIMKCMVSGVPDVHLQTLTLLNQRCTISILNGALAEKDEKQRDLPLEGGGPNEGGEAAAESGEEAPTMLDKEGSPTLHDAQREEDEAIESAIGRQIRASEVRKARKSSKKKSRR